MLDFFLSNVSFGRQRDVSFKHQNIIIDSYLKKKYVYVQFTEPSVSHFFQISEYFEKLKFEFSRFCCLNIVHLILSALTSL